MDTLNLLRYWRNALADMDKLGLSAKQMQQGETFHLSNIQEGKLSEKRIERFFIKAEQYQKKPIEKKFQKDAKPSPILKLPVIISLYKAVKIHEHGQRIAANKGEYVVLPLWLVADLTRNGELKPSEQSVYPWIDRRFLTPNESFSDYPVIGDVGECDQFYNRKPGFFNESDQVNWEKLFEFSKDLFQHVAGENPVQTFFQRHYELKEISSVLPLSDIYNTSQYIINTYDQYIFDKTQKLPHLLEKFCCLKVREHQFDLSPDELLMMSKRHLGQPQGNYPLSSSQRIALSYFFDEENQEIVTINGPPGTGKTNLLFSMIASLWIDRAIQKKMPPILVAASTNNLAVTNILDNFQAVDRWLPDLHQYCLYLPSSYKIEEAKENKYLYRLKGKEGGCVDDFYLLEYQDKAKKYFLEKFNSHYAKSEVDLNACQAYIHQNMLDIQSGMDAALDIVRELYQVNKQIQDHYGNASLLDEHLLKKQGEKNLLENVLKKMKKVRSDWFYFKLEKLKWYHKIIYQLGLKNSLRNKIQYFTSLHPDLFIDILSEINLVEDTLEQKVQNENEKYRQIIHELTDLESLKMRCIQLNEKKIDCQKKLGFEFDIENLYDFTDKQSLPAKLDIHLRYPLFVLATHYWEVAWLIHGFRLAGCSFNFEGRREYWEIQAMLTPCFVTTLHSGPSFFRYLAPSQEFNAMANLIDLLIIDEAGQVLPAIAGAMISIAKRTLFIGDVKQIEPIAPLTENIDLANAKKFGLCHDVTDYDSLKKSGILCASDTLSGHAHGNVIVLGQRKAKYHLLNQRFPGMLLKEHRRCAREIISYCNELCYDNQLVIMTEEKPSRYPRMGYAHIKGCEKRYGSSRINSLEAEAIVAWISANQEDILKNCAAQSLDDCIGIVTPFKAQEKCIRSLLNKCHLNIQKVGTIHALQGAEKPIIIFSSVYTAETSGHFFFDVSPNMLNVAVSRAKMSFIVFGDMDIFDPEKIHTPSGLLARYLFAEESNEVVNVIQPKFVWVDQKEIQQITTLEDHRRALKESFSLAVKQLNIISPFLRKNAVTLDKIPELIQQHRQYKTINIYTDPTLNQRNWTEFNNVIKILEDAGAQVFLANKVHSKVIIIDDRIIIEGSFNWLSASRDGRYIREECSIRYQGDQVVQFIQEILEPVRKKVVVKIPVEDIAAI